MNCVQDRNAEALPKQIELTEGEVVYLKDALQMLPPGLNVSESRFRQWCRDGRYGIVAGTFGGRVVVRKDTIPRVMPLE